MTFIDDLICRTFISIIELCKFIDNLFFGKDFCGLFFAIRKFEEPFEPLLQALTKLKVHPARKSFQIQFQIFQTWYILVMVWSVS